MDDKPQLNLFNEIIEECSCEPLTGFFRTGCCDTSDQDLGSHTVCALMTEDFLKFSIARVMIFPLPCLNIISQD